MSLALVVAQVPPTVTIGAVPGLGLICSCRHKTKVQIHFGTSSRYGLGNHQELLEAITEASTIWMSGG